MWEPPEYPDLVSTFILTDLKGSCSRPKKLLENVCAAGASPVAGVSFSTFVRFHSLSHRILLLSLSMNLQQLNELCCWTEWLRLKKEKRYETVITFLALRIQKKE